MNIRTSKKQFRLLSKLLSFFGYEFIRFLYHFEIIDCKTEILKSFNNKKDIADSKNCSEQCPFC